MWVRIATTTTLRTQIDHPPYLTHNRIGLLCVPYYHRIGLLCVPCYHHHTTKVNYPPYFFEVDLLAPVDHVASKAAVGTPPSCPLVTIDAPL